MDMHNWAYNLKYFLVLGVVFSPVYCDGLSEWDKVLLAARCRVQCLITYQLSDASPDFELLGPRFRHANILTHCLDNPSCKECMRPCSTPYIDLVYCKRVCEVGGEDQDNNQGCSRSCDHLDSIFRQHSGQCPSPGRQSLPSNPSSPNERPSLLSEESCGPSCRQDPQCSVDQKCCDTTSCGRTCIVPDNRFQGMPPVPLAPTIRERAKGGSIELKWELPNDTSSDPVLFIISSRYKVGRDPDEQGMTQWQQHAQTVSESANIRYLTPGHWYQFKVMAVNQQGSRGFSSTTQPYRLSKEPDPPSPPRNLIEGDTIIKNSKIGVIIKWSKPEHSDLPISKYKIFWSKQVDADNPEVYTLDEQKRVLPAEMEQFEIPDLEPSTTYLIQLMSLSEYGSEKLKSERVPLYITTFPLPSQHDPVDIRPLPAPPAVETLTAHQPYYQNGLLKANVTWEFPPNSRLMGSELPPQGTAYIERVLVHWVPEACITDDISRNKLSQTLSVSTQEQFFVIYDLRFDCHYRIKVQSVSRDGVTGTAVQLSFQTPSCSRARVVGNVEPSCPTNLPRIPEQPPNFQYTILINRNNLTAKLSWREPYSDTPILGYRVVYGPALLTEGTTEARLDKTMSMTKVLTPSNSSFSITGLQEMMTYVAQVQAFSVVGNGRTAKTQFTTPMLTLQRQPDRNQDRNRNDESPNYHHVDNSRHTSSEDPSHVNPSLSHRPDSPRETSENFYPNFQATNAAQSWHYSPILNWNMSQRTVWSHLCSFLISLFLLLLFTV